MSLALTFTLPDQPATGTAHKVSLGGDGYRSPSSVYVVRNVSLTGDSSAGSLSIAMGLDPDYVSMIGYVSVSISQATPSAERMKFQHVGALVATMQENRVTAFTNGSVVPEVAEMWLPPPVLIPGVTPGTTSMLTDNIEDDIYIFNAQIFLYNIRAMELTPYDLLVAARGGV